eukprot:scaffold224161_cov26-Prasinocladus_malaysianus.AAC.1
MLVYSTAAAAMRAAGAWEAVASRGDQCCHSSFIVAFVWCFACSWPFQGHKTPAPNTPLTHETIISLNVSPHAGTIA